MNGSSKVRVSYSKYRMVPEQIIWDDSEEEEEEDEDERNRDLDRFETKEKELGLMPLCGYKKVGRRSKNRSRHGFRRRCWGRSLRRSSRSKY